MHPGLYASTLLLFAASALLLTVIQPPIGWSFLAWVAFVPFVLACSPHIRTRSVAFWAFVVGFLYWLGNLYWIEPITTLGWLGMGLYLSLFWGLPALAVRAARQARIPLFIALPILLAGWERAQGFPLGGFFWRFLGHSQYKHLAIIQVADLVGTAGVSFVVAMVNGLLADLIVKREAYLVKRGPGSDASRLTLHASRPLAAGFALTGAVLAGTILYGQWRLRETPEHVADGPLVGSLQSNVPQSVKQSFSESGKLFDELMVSSKAAAAAGAGLILWPETMVQGILDPELWPHLRSSHEEDADTFLAEDKAFHKALCEHAKDTGSALLVGAYGMEIRQDRRGEPYLASFNSAYFYHPDGSRDPSRYDKIHLVLFGEYIPFRQRFPWLFDLLKELFPEGYNPTYTLERGTHYTVFEMFPKDREQKTEDGASPQPPGRVPWRFGTIICYEDAIPYVGRNFALDKEGNKRIDWLVNISNDGWFVRFPEAEGRVTPSSELSQHAAICAFRAVENRLAVVRSVNTGISCLIESTGRIRDGYQAASEGFPLKAMNRTALAGWFVDRLPIDDRVTFYSRHGEWFANGCAGVFATALLWPPVAGRRRTKAKTA